MRRTVIIIPPLPRGAPGPTDTSHYVLDNLIAGAYPGDQDEKKHKDKLTKILQAGVTSFISLIHDKEVSKFRSYEDTVKELVPQVSVCRYGVIDGTAPSKELLEKILTKLNELLRGGHKVYLHCWGGHSRTGLVVCMLLARNFFLPFKEALKLTYYLHTKRKVQSGGHSKKQVLTRKQLALVKELLPSD